MRFEIPKGDNRPRYCCTDCGFIHYQNPRMIVGCIIEDSEGKILLAKRGIEPRKGFWNLPCGFLENDEGVENGALREVLEETGAAVDIENLHTVYNLPKAQQVYLIFKAKLKNDTRFITNEESTEIALFAPADIPWQELAFSSNVHAIKHLLSLQANPEQAKLNIGSYPDTE